MPDQPPPGESESESPPDSDDDRIFNAETNRALRKWGRRLSAVGAGVLTAIVMLIPVVVTALRSVGLLFHLAVTLAVSLSLPVIATYVAVRTYGLSHHEAVYVGKQAVGEAVAATVTLGAHQRAEQPMETIETDATTPFTDTDNDETQ
jgi:hypothetical protein